MTLKKFFTLDEMEQIEVVWYDSEKLAVRNNESHLFELYSCNDFFIELKYKESDILIGCRAFYTDDSWEIIALK
jgi:hypothetical protein